jgi:hypothetical protein
VFFGGNHNFKAKQASKQPRKQSSKSRKSSKVVKMSQNVIKMSQNDLRFTPTDLLQKSSKLLTFWPPFETSFSTVEVYGVSTSRSPLEKSATPTLNPRKA